jgi:hypothetical protein
MSIEAMKQALDALEHVFGPGKKCAAAKTVLRAAIKQAEKQEQQGLTNEQIDSAVPEALRLADELDAVPENGADPDLIQKAAAELRQLHSENAELLEALRWIERRCPAQFLLQELHRIHMEAAHDAGACARATIAKVKGKA